MQYFKQQLSNGQTVLTLVLEGNEGLTFNALASGFTIGGVSMAGQLAQYNGATNLPDQILTGTYAIPESWLNGSGRSLLNYATPASGALSIDIRGTARPAGAFASLTPTQWALIGAGALMVLASM